MILFAGSSVAWLGGAGADHVRRAGRSGGGAAEELLMLKSESQASRDARHAFPVHFPGLSSPNVCRRMATLRLWPASRKARAEAVK